MENTTTKKSLLDELIEDNELNQKIIKSFQSKETLCPEIFVLDENNQMVKGVRDKLLSISNTFIDFLGVEFFIYDIILTGSLSNYNWSEYSDVDLHIFIDLDEFGQTEINNQTIKKIMKEFFDTKKNNWKSLYNITIKNFEVELYIQDINERHLSSGVYSILNDEWIIKPQKGKEGISEKEILCKGREFMDLIDHLIKMSTNGIDITHEIDTLKDKIKKFRQSGLDKGGEYSYENLTFKLLRRNGYIGKLFDLKKNVLNKKLSITD
jgi:hypothetical protein